MSQVTSHTKSLPFTDVQADCLQQFINNELVQLPMLLVDGKLTGIAGVVPVATVSEAHEIAQVHADKLLATKH